MVARILRLRVALALAALRGPRRNRMALGFIALAVTTVLLCRAALELDQAPVATAQTFLTLGVAVVAMAYVIGPFLFGARDPLDPQLFAVFAIDVKSMPWRLALAALVSIPSLALIAMAACLAVVLTAQGASLGLALSISAVLVVTILLGSRAAMAVNARLFPHRRSREVTVLFSLIVLMVILPALLFLGTHLRADVVPPSVQQLATVVGFTPLAAPVGLGFAAIEGDTGAIWAGATVATASLIGVWIAWSALVRVLLTSTPNPASLRSHAGMGWFAVLPSTPAGVIAARSLIYWFRDRRYIMNFSVVPFASVVTMLPLVVAGVPFHLAVFLPVLVIALFFGWLVHNDIAYDSTAFWVHVASGVKGSSDRLGRLAPIVLLAVPILGVAIPLTVSLAGNWPAILPLTGAVVCLFLTGLGVSCVSSVVAPYAVSRPGDSPFQQPQRRNRGSSGQAIAFLSTISLSTPAIWLLVQTLAGRSDLAVYAFWVGIGTGVVVLVLGVVVGGMAFNRRTARLMEFVETT